MELMLTNLGSVHYQQAGEQPCIAVSNCHAASLGFSTNSLRVPGNVVACRQYKPQQDARALLAMPAHVDTLAENASACHTDMTSRTVTPGLLNH